MAGQVVQMDYPVVQSIAKGFKAQAQVVQAVGTAGVALFTALEAGAFWNPALSQYYGQCKRAVDKKSKQLVKTCEEFADDLERAVQDHKNGDSAGKRYFGMS